MLLVPVKGISKPGNTREYEYLVGNWQKGNTSNIRVRARSDEFFFFFFKKIFYKKLKNVSCEYDRVNG